MPGGHEFTYNEFRKIQRIRGRMSGVARRKRTRVRDRLIRQARKRGLSLRKIAARFGLALSTVHYICRGRGWMMKRPFLRHPGGWRGGRSKNQLRLQARTVISRDSSLLPSSDLTVLLAEWEDWDPFETTGPPALA